MATILDTLITDRTQADVDRAKYLESLWVQGQNKVLVWSGSLDEYAEWEAGPKGEYRDGDLNRIESAMEYVASVLEQVGHPVKIYLRKDKWVKEDEPLVGDGERILASVDNIRKAIDLPEDTPETPEDMVLMNYEEANAIEQILLNAGKRSEALSAIYLHSNEANCGYDGSDLA